MQYLIFVAIISTCDVISFIFPNHDVHDILVLSIETRFHYILSLYKLLWIFTTIILYMELSLVNKLNFYFSHINVVFISFVTAFCVNNI